MDEQWAVACGCDYHGDHLGCTVECQTSLGCQHPLGVIVTTASEDPTPEEIESALQKADLRARLGGEG